MSAFSMCCFSELLTYSSNEGNASDWCMVRNAMRLYLLNSRTEETERQLSNGCVTRNMEQLLEAVSSVRSVPMFSNEDQLSLRQSLETAVRRVGGWCEMAASLREIEPGSRRTSTVGRRYQAAQWRTWLRTLVCVWEWSAKCSNDFCVACAINPITNPNSVYSHSIT
jgi:hypothetical protein